MKKDHNYDIIELQLTQLVENLGAIRKTKNTSCKFGSLLVCIFFYVQNSFPTIGTIVWDRTRPMTKQINDFIEQLGEIFETIMDGYYEEFKGKMKNRLRIPQSVIDHYYEDICFMMEIDFTYVQVPLPRLAWIRPM